MLSFEYTPASLFNSDYLMRPHTFGPEYLFGRHPQRQHPLHHCYHQHPQPKRTARSRSCRPRRANEEDYLVSLLDKLVSHAEEQTPRKPEVEAKVFNTKDSYQIQVRKNDSDFTHYSISYKLTGNDAVIVIESEVDDFAKGFKFALNKINMSNVEWKVVRNVLVINVPRSNDGFVLKPALVSFTKKTKEASNPRQGKSAQRPIEAPVPTRQTNKSSVESRSSTPATPSTPSESSTPLQEQSAPQVRVISIPIEFEDSEAEITPRSSRRSSITDSIRSNTRTESEAELSDDEFAPSAKLPKLKRKVSIEEVEDESLHMADLD